MISRVHLPSEINRQTRTRISGAGLCKTIPSNDERAAANPARTLLRRSKETLATCLKRSNLRCGSSPEIF